MSIPNLLFQTSKGPAQPRVKEFLMKRCRRWSYKHFRDKDCIDFFKHHPLPEFPLIALKFQSFKRGEHKADIFRYYYLYIKGGVYLDMDVMLERDIKNIIQKYDFITVKSFLRPAQLFNGFIGCGARNQIIHKALAYAYNVDSRSLKEDYHFFCKYLYKLVKEDSLYSKKIYKEVRMRKRTSWDRRSLRDLQLFPSSLHGGNAIINESRARIASHYFLANNP